MFSFLIGSISAQKSGDPKSDKIFEKAKTAYSKGDLEKAKKYTSDILRSNPNYVPAYLLNSDIGLDLNDEELWLESLQKIIEIDPVIYPTAFYLLGNYHMSKGQYGKAGEYYSQFGKFQKDTNHPLWSRANEGVSRALFAQNLKKLELPFKPENMGKEINSADNEYFPSLTTNDKELLFTRETLHPQRRVGQEDFYYAIRDEKWTTAIPIKELNTPFNEGAPVISADGRIMIFTTCELQGEELAYPGNKRGFGSCDLFYSEKVNGKWSPGINLGKAINSWHWESQPSLSADGRSLYFIRGYKSREDGRIKNQDIFYSELDIDGVWSKAKKMSDVINTSGKESSVMIHPNGRSLYFSSDGHFGLGGDDIFVSHFEKGEWSKPINLGYPINTHKNENSITVAASGEIALFASERDGGFGGLDLYEFELPEFAKAKAVSYVQGMVIDEQTKAKVAAQIQIFDLKTGDMVAETFSDPMSGEFLITLPTENAYALNASALGYLLYSQNFDFKAVENVKGVDKVVEMKRIKEGNSIVLENIFFDSDKSSLKESSIPELNKLLEILNYYPELKIEIQGHTDNVGEDSYNLKLSQDRAQSVLNWLGEKGIDQDRLSAKGFGETKAIASNENEEGRAKNRRTEILILSSE